MGIASDDYDTWVQIARGQMSDSYGRYWKAGQPIEDADVDDDDDL